MKEAGIWEGKPEHHLFRTAVGRTKQLRDYQPEVTAPNGTVIEKARGAMGAHEMRRMLKRRLKDAGFATTETKRTPGLDKNGRNHTYTNYVTPYSPHSFRVMVVTDLLKQGAPLEEVAYLVGHGSVRTTKGYSRMEREVTRNLVERIRVKMPKDDEGGST